MGNTTSSSNTYDSKAMVGVLSDTLNQQFISISQKSTNTNNPTQSIKISGVKTTGKFVASDIKQVIVARIDSSSFISNVTETTLKTKLSAALDVARTANQDINSGLSVGQDYNTSNTTKTETSIDVTSKVVNSYSYNTFVNDVNAIFSSQEISFGDIDADEGVEITNISQYVQTEILCKRMAETMVKTIIDTAIDADLKLKEDISQTNTSGVTSDALVAMVIMIIIIIVVALVVAVGGYFAVRKFVFPFF